MKTNNAVRRNRKFQIVGGTVKVIAADIDCEGPFPMIRLSWTANGKDRLRVLIGDKADSFISWELSVTDWYAEFHADQLPEELAKYVGDVGGLAPAGALQILRYMTAVAHEGNPTSAA